MVNEGILDLCSVDKFGFRLTHLIRGSTALFPVRLLPNYRCGVLRIQPLSVSNLFPSSNSTLLRSPNSILLCYFSSFLLFFFVCFPLSARMKALCTRFKIKQITKGVYFFFFVDFELYSTRIRMNLEPTQCI